MLANEEPGEEERGASAYSFADVGEVATLGDEARRRWRADGGEFRVDKSVVIVVSELDRLEGCSDRAARDGS